MMSSSSWSSSFYNRSCLATRCFRQNCYPIFSTPVYLFVPLIYSKTRSICLYSATCIILLGSWSLMTVLGNLLATCSKVAFRFYFLYVLSGHTAACEELCMTNNANASKILARRGPPTTSACLIMSSTTSWVFSMFIFSAMTLKRLAS